MPRHLDYQHRISLEGRTDEAATRELVDFFLDGDPGTRLEIARALARRVLPVDVRSRVAALILDDSLEGAESFVRWPLAIAAQALLDQPAEEAFALAEPLLHVNASSRPFDRWRAEVLVGAVEQALADRSALVDKTVVVDPRFRSLCEQLQRNDPSLANVAAQAIDGFRHFDGEDVEPVARTVSLGEDDDPPFPFLIAGFPVETWEQRKEINAVLCTLARGRPPGLAWFEHQYGGLACLQAQILGYGVVAPDAPPFAGVLAALSEAWWETRGESMTPPDLYAWSGRLAGLLPPEGAESGAEALLVSGPCAPIQTLGGYEVLGFGYKGAPWRSYVDAGFEPDITRRGPYGDAHERMLLHMGEALGLGRPRVVLLWGNSD